MSLRYTGEATMDEPALRDVEQWKDKIEVRLDNRQVFFLFFGSAMVACMLFVLGVIVGKRLESRGRAEAPVIEDPLAALDRFGAASAPASSAAAPLTFPRALLGNGMAAKSARPERPSNGRVGTGAVSPLALPRAGAKGPEAGAFVARSTLATVLPAGVSAQPALGVVPDSIKRSASLPHPVASAPAASGNASVVPPKTPTTSPRATSPPSAKASTSISGAKSSVQPAVKAPATAARSDKAKANFLLQLSSFQDRAEADSFARRFSAQNAYVVASEVPGKGLWYRVRVGSYGNLKDATFAKSAFEREQGVIAYVAGTGPVH